MLFPIRESSISKSLSIPDIENFGNCLCNALILINSTTFKISSSVGGVDVGLLNSVGSSGVISNVTSVTSNVNITLLKNDILFTDVTQIGSTRAGQGLITYYYYY